MALTDAELEYVKKELGREPNSLEYGMLDIMFSEHCSYKSSRPILRLFPNEGEKVILGPGDDAGIVELTDELALVIGMESHNHPSAIEPYGGAGTGIGGIIRDIISMGAKPVALLDSLRFGYLEDQKSRYLFEHVVKGISDYGNRVGIPTVGGEVEFDDNFKSNPLVNVVCVGLVRKEEIVLGVAPNIGDVFVLMGGRTGRDGIHGVTFASEELTTKSEIEDRPAVQVGDPFTKKQVMEATFEALEKIDVQGLKDLGGGGLTCCISEMAAKAENGAVVELTKIPLREEGMTPYEIMLSESQERMVFVVRSEDVDALMAIFDKYELPAAAIGTVTDDGQFVMTQDGKVISKLPCELLADPPSVEREALAPSSAPEVVEVPDVPFEDALLKLLSSENIASKKWVYRQYDHEVQVRTVVKPGDDAAVMKVDDEKAFAITSDCNSIHTKLDPYHGGAGSVAEAIRNVVSMGAEPICIADCLNFGNPEKPEVFWQFRECVKGMSDIANKFKTPVISGNVSFYNETEGVTVNPSPVVGVAGSMDLKDIRTSEFKTEGDEIIVIGKTQPELGGSEYYRSVHGVVAGKAPKVHIDQEYSSAMAVLDLIRNDDEGNVTAVHDCSAGGLGIALSEMAISSGTGAFIDISKVPVEADMDITEMLFSESHGRYIVTVKADTADEVVNKIKSMNVEAAAVGKVGGSMLILDEKVEIAVSKLEEYYSGVIEKFMA
ncbi:phosphoribosylformylglycinamidine synthase subunit PurL [Methanobacterium aggregans]|uniref:phosphoribosylformylglycinamidine synthase subunit PurL n=1 Tax=Methanobacterium aggregans TaxID=1615586 RepID=UPI001AEB38B1|nr:phosphoribosylformylglycinamidine synthase subunit PurL [Methanobacterium aggregans]MBP2045904.1 phosphoribosylformylglycinamidine synthase [Methanobacterium aggregans]